MRNVLFLISFIVIFFASGQNDSLREELLKLDISVNLQHFLDTNPDARLQLFDVFHDSVFIADQVLESDWDIHPVLHDWQEEKVRLISDTTLTLLSFDFIFLSNDRYTPEQQVRILRKISKSSGKRKKFDQYIARYGNTDPLFHRMYMMDAVLIEDEIKDEIIQNQIGEIDGVSTERGMFICYTTVPAMEVNAYLGIVVP